MAENRFTESSTFTPPAGVRAEARRALEWMKEGEAGSGFTSVGRRRAAQLANGQPVSLRTIRRMASYLARHRVDREGEGYKPGSPGYPSPGRVAWAAWGGDAAIGWTNRILRSAEAEERREKTATPEKMTGEERRRAKRRKRKRDGWQNLIERGVMGIDTLPGGGLVSAKSETKAAKRRKARADRLAATPAPSKDRIVGSAQNKPGTAASRSAGDDIVINEATLAALKKKVEEHNEKYKNGGPGKQASLGALKAVYRRGAGAFSVSHRPGMTRNQWAMGRVNAFLKILASGKPSNPRYINDNDLLPSDHPLKKNDLTDVETKRLGQGLATGRRIRRLRRAAGTMATLDLSAEDGDGDGMVQDGTPFERAVAAAKKLVKKFKTRKRLDQERNDLSSILERLKEKDGGFSLRISDMSDATSGWAIARRGRGVAIPASRMYDDDDNLRPEAPRLMAAFLENFQEDFKEPQERGREVVMGGWHNPATGMIHLDVTDVYSKDSTTREQAIAKGAEQDQISIADLDMIQEALADGDWSRDTVIDTGGSGGEVVDLSELEASLRQMAEEFGEVEVESGNRVIKGPEAVDMHISDPIPELAKHLGRQEDWRGVKAIDPQRRKEIADAYDAAVDTPAENMPEELRRSYEVLREEIRKQFKLLQETGVRVEFVDEDPYKNFHEMREDYVTNGRLKVLKTERTGGHPFFTNEENDMFRAVHDAFGHLASGRGFDRHGEEAAYRAHRTMFPEGAVPALATELRAQNAFLIDRGDFGPQKLVLLEERMHKALMLWRKTQELNDGNKDKAQRDSDADNAYDKTGSHHVTGGRVLREKKNV